MDNGSNPEAEPVASAAPEDDGALSDVDLEVVSGGRVVIGGP